MILSNHKGFILYQYYKPFHISPFMMVLFQIMLLAIKYLSLSGKGVKELSFLLTFNITLM